LAKITELLKRKDRLLNNAERKIVSVFGSANTAPNTPDFEAAYIVGKTLAQAGYDVMTGGYDGAMRAASQGAHEAGGHVIGVTVGLFKERGLIPNDFLREEVHLMTLVERLNYLIFKPDAYVVVRGGIGTLSELSLAWSLMEVGEIPARPIVLQGTMWADFVEHFTQISTMGDRALGWVKKVDRAEEVTPTLQSWWAAPPQVPLRLGDKRGV
jgi:uncharacterized protein (TIGR00730 family)